MDDHLASSCPMRKLKCGCGVNTTVVDHSIHLALECSQVEVPCDLGCGKAMLRGKFAFSSVIVFLCSAIVQILYKWGVIYCYTIENQ